MLIAVQMLVLATQVSELTSGSLIPLQVPSVPQIQLPFPQTRINTNTNFSATLAAETLTLCASAIRSNARVGPMGGKKAYQ